MSYKLVDYRCSAVFVQYPRVHTQLQLLLVHCVSSVDVKTGICDSTAAAACSMLMRNAQATYADHYNA
jgi:hypothetical protein